MKVGVLSRAMEDERLIARYAESRRSEKKEHPLKHDIEALRQYVEWLRFSGEASMPAAGPAEAATPSDAPQFTEKSSLPVASVGDILRFPAKWDGGMVIVEGGEMVHVSRENLGRCWHLMSDGTGRIAVLSSGKLEHSKGTLFGVAKVTPSGRQPYIEAKNFRPLHTEDAAGPPPAGANQADAQS